MKKHLFALCAVPFLALPALAHNFSQKGYGQLKTETQNFAHASSSKTAKINAPMPNFSVQTMKGDGLSKASFKGKLSLFVIADTQCPCLQAVEERIKAISARYQSKGLRVVYVFSKPGERAIDVARFMQNHVIGFPAVLDKKQQILKMLDGRCSSEVYLFDKQTILRYHGRVDDETFDPKAARQHNLADAVSAVATGKPVPRPEAPAMGCSIPRL